MKLDFDVMQSYGLHPDAWYGYERDIRAMMTAQYIINSSIKSVSQYEQNEELKRKRK